MHGPDDAYYSDSLVKTAALRVPNSCLPVEVRRFFFSRAVENPLVASASWSLVAALLFVA
jgi:hypothetical protein